MAPTQAGPSVSLWPFWPSIPFKYILKDGRCACSLPRTELLFSSYTGKGVARGYSLNCAPSLGAGSTNTECFPRHRLGAFAPVKHPEPWSSSGLDPNSRGPSTCVRPRGQTSQRSQRLSCQESLDLGLEPRAGVSHLLCPP